jgi:hypothetical protein
VGAAFDDARNQLIIVGGYAPAAVAAETWAWKGASWSRLASTGPSPREEPMLVYDRARKQVILFGGDRQTEPAMSDTWAWDGATWRDLRSSGPVARSSAIVYDSRRNRIVLFGGATNPTGLLHNDTWEWDGKTWLRVVADSLPTSPAPRALHGLAYDERRGRVVLMGGFAMVDGRPEVFGDTWEWDGSIWRQVNVPGPGPRDHTAMVYSPEHQAVVLHGGGQPATGLMGDTWLYDGSAWVRLLTDGPRRGRHRLVHDAATHAVLLYGGRDPNQPVTDLWRLSDSGWTRLSP